MSESSYDFFEKQIKPEFDKLVDENNRDAINTFF